MSALPSNLFARYWRRFLPLWLFPVAFMGACLIGDFSSNRGLLYGGLAVTVVYFFVSFFWAQCLWFRGEISYVQTIALSAPFMGVWVLLVLVRAVLFTFIGKPL